MKLFSLEEFLQRAGIVWKNIIDFPNLTQMKSMKEVYATTVLRKHLTETIKEMIEKDAKDKDGNTYQNISDRAIKAFTESSKYEETVYNDFNR